MVLDGPVEEEYNFEGWYGEVYKRKVVSEKKRCCNTTYVVHGMLYQERDMIQGEKICKIDWGIVVGLVYAPTNQSFVVVNCNHCGERSVNCDFMRECCNLNWKKFEVMRVQSIKLLSDTRYKGYVQYKCRSWGHVLGPITVVHYKRKGGDAFGCYGCYLDVLCLAKTKLAKEVVVKFVKNGVVEYVDRTIEINR